MRDRIRNIISFLWGLRVKRVNSALNGALEVWYIKGKYQLDAKSVNYSYGSLHRLFQRVFNETGIKKMQPSSLLLLGLGGGSVISIIRNDLGLSTRITAVEHDPEIIKLAEDYFGIRNFDGVTVFLEDALDFVSKSREKYDVIVVDLLHDRDVPEKFISGDFVKACAYLLNANGMILFNFIILTKNHHRLFNRLVDLFREFANNFSIIEAFVTYRVIVYRKPEAGN